MFSHVTIGVNDMKQAKRFYDAIFACLGPACFYENEDHVGYGLVEGE